MVYEKIKVWGVLLRLYHWTLVLSIVALVATGFYINNPWTNTTLEGSVAWPMATMRYIHFLAGYCFTAAILVRLFLLLFGNRQERIMDFLPITPRNIKNLFATVKCYLYIGNEHDERLGHNVLAGTTYLLTFVLALLQLVAGFFLLFPEAVFWQGLGGALFETQQQARFIHHLLMWYFLIFALVHIYLVIWNDLRSSEGLISSIFTGNKFKPGKVS